MNLKNYEEREKAILEHGKKILESRTPPDKDTINAEFYFRFDWWLCMSINSLRGKMRGVIDQSGEAPLSQEDASRWLFHIEGNRNIRTTIVHTEKGPQKQLHTENNKGYLPINLQLRERDKQALQSGSPEENERLYNLIWHEARRTMEIISEISTLGIRCMVLPSKTEKKLFSDEQRERLFSAWIMWVLMGQTVPQFVYPDISFLESRTEEPVKRIIRPVLRHQIVQKKGRINLGRWQDNEDGTRTFMEKKEKRGKRISAETRTRTWAIYFMTRRGGGRLTEREAVTNWYESREDNFILMEYHLVNFRKARCKILVGSKKRLRY